MNFQNLNFDYVEPPRQRTQPHIPPSPGSSTTPSEQSVDTVLPYDNTHDYASFRPASPSPQPTVVPYAPSPPSVEGSYSEIYGPDRYFGEPLLLSNHAFARLRNIPQLPLDEIHDMNRALQQTLIGQMMFNSRGYKDDLAFEAGKVTPGIDNAPYIQYALEVMTRDPGAPYAQHASAASDETNPFRRPVIPDTVPEIGPNYYTPIAFPPTPPPAHTAYTSKPKVVHVRKHDPVKAQRETARHRPLAAFDPHTPSPGSSLSTLVPQPKIKREPYVPKDYWALIDFDRLPRRAKMHIRRDDFVPPILRATSMITLMILCILMIAALMFCAIYSQLRSGLVPFNGSIYGGQYFLFRILPQMLAAAIQLYIHAVITTVFRIHAFARMQGRTPEERYGAIFQDLYPKSYLYPQLIGTWRIWVPCLVAWIANIALPLQSALFTVLRIDGIWRWATVQGIAWTLVAIYIAVLACTAILYAYWKDRKTGLLWDPRCIADIIALTTNSNVLQDYAGTEQLATRDQLRRQLRRREVDQLGYWRWRDARDNDLWHGIASELQDEAWLDRAAIEARAAGRKLREKTLRDSDVERNTELLRFRYLPWCLRNNQMLYFLTTAVILLTALLVVSFLPATSLRRGFEPWVPSEPTPGAFSAANFLYAFLPALLGQILWLLFLSLEQSLRILQPWAELQSADGHGALPGKSILADYAACLPGQGAWRAARNGHWRLAVLSAMSVLFILIPVCAGGLFMALTVSTEGVRMLPNLPLFGVVLALLVLYVACLIALLPGRQAFRLPHAVTCIAEVASFVANDDAMADEAFKHARHRTYVQGRLGVDRAPEQQPRWVFGLGGPGARGDGRLGVRRMRRFTELEKRVSRRRQREVRQGVMV